MRIHFLKATISKIREFKTTTEKVEILRKKTLILISYLQLFTLRLFLLKLNTALIKTEE
jgi:hypothetical protein